MSERSRARRSTAVALLPVAGALVAVAVVALLLIHNPRLGTAHAAGGPTTSASPSTPSTSTSPIPSFFPGTPAVARGGSNYAVPEKTVLVVPKTLSTGSAPGIAYVVGSQSPPSGKIHPADGGPAIPIQLGAGEIVRSFTRFKDGFLVLVENRSHATVSDEIRYYSSPEQMTVLVPAQPAWTDEFARGADGSVAASMSPRQVTLFDASGTAEQTWAVPRDAFTDPTRVLPNHRVIVRIDSVRFTKRLRLAPGGSITRARGLTGRATDISPANGDVSMSEGCYGYPGDNGGVIDAKTGQVRWIDCGYEAGFFSPDGTLVAEPANGIPYSATHLLGIMDAATGDLLVSFQVPSAAWDGRIILHVAWEDNTHVLVYACSRHGCAVFRLGVDGSVEKAAASIPAYGYVKLEG